MIQFYEGEVVSFMSNPHSSFQDTSYK